MSVLGDKIKLLHNPFQYRDVGGLFCNECSKWGATPYPCETVDYVKAYDV